MIVKDLRSYELCAMTFVMALFLATAISDTDNCGQLSIDEPVILGKNVTFTFTPDDMNDGAMLAWQRSNKENPWSNLPNTTKFIQYRKDRTYYLILTNTVSTPEKDDAIYYRVQYNTTNLRCTMETQKLDPKPISDTYKCGQLSIEEPVILGKNVTFTFTPDDMNDGSMLAWQRSNKVNPWSNLPNTTKFIQYRKDRTYYLILTNTVSTKKEDDAIFYRVQFNTTNLRCTMETQKLDPKPLEVDVCGQLNIKEPTILGRNVTFTFTPNYTDVDSTVTWQRTNKNNPWSTLPRKPKFTQYMENGTYYLVLTNTVSIKKKDDAIYYRVKYNTTNIRCTMETSKLNLTDISGKLCGFLYLRNKPVYNKDLEIEYYPKKKILNKPDSYKRMWIIERKSGIKKLEGNETGLYTDMKAENEKYVLIIHRFNASMNGKYKIMCRNRLDHYSNEVDVILPVAPQPPVFNNLRNIDKCVACLIGEVGDTLDVSCKIEGGTEPMTVDISFGNKTVNNLRLASTHTTKVYKASFELQESHHGAMVNCSVINEALTSPLVNTAKLYLIQRSTPEIVLLSDVIKDGDAVNIECKFSAARPYLNLSFVINNTTIPAQQITDDNPSDQTYSGVISLKKFEKSWNGKNITCCQSNKWLKDGDKCITRGPLKYIFPPSDVKLNISVERSEDQVQIKARCSIIDSNPMCRASWLAPKGSILSAKSTWNISRPNGAWTSDYEVMLNTTINYAGEQIACVPNCSHFNVSLLSQVKIPYAPVIEFNTSGPLLLLQLGSVVNVKCTAISQPAATITWIEQIKSGRDILWREQLRCFGATECVLTLKGDHVTHKNISCVAHNLLGENRRNLSVFIFDISREDSFGMVDGIVLGAVVGLAVVMVTVCLIIRRRSTPRKGKSTSVTQNASCSFEPGASNTNRDISRLQEPAESRERGDMVCDEARNPSSTDDFAIYSQVCKTRQTSKIPSNPNPNQYVDERQLLYADLALDPAGSIPMKDVNVRRRDSQTEYVGIDFLKTAEFRDTAVAQMK